MQGICQIRRPSIRTNANAPDATSFTQFSYQSARDGLIVDWYQTTIFTRLPGMGAGGIGGGIGVNCMGAICTGVTGPIRTGGIGGRLRSGSRDAGAGAGGGGAGAGSADRRPGAGSGGGGLGAV